jgi:hypothetical protein
MTQSYSAARIDEREFHFFYPCLTPGEHKHFKHVKPERDIRYLVVPTGAPCTDYIHMPNVEINNFHSLKHPAKI